MRLEFREVTKDSWGDFATLFEERGGPKSCWCMVWRASTAEAKQRGGNSRREQIKARVDRGTHIGIIGYFDRKPVAWCSVAPRETYRNLRGSSLSETERVWSLACMFVKRSFRGKGLTPQIVQSAAAHAKANNTTNIEAYPVDRDSPSYRFMGLVETFALLGFREVGKAGDAGMLCVFNFDRSSESA